MDARIRKAIAHCQEVQAHALEVVSHCLRRGGCEAKEPDPIVQRFVDACRRCVQMCREMACVPERAQAGLSTENGPAARS